MIYYNILVANNEQLEFPSQCKVLCFEVLHMYYICIIYVKSIKMLGFARFANPIPTVSPTPFRDPIPQP